MLTFYLNRNLIEKGGVGKSTVTVNLAAIIARKGFYSGSTALIADAVHTSLDIFTSLAVWIGLKFSMENRTSNNP